MKRCPHCRRDYYDDSLLYCFEDGTTLVDGPARLAGRRPGTDEPATQLMSAIGSARLDEAADPTISAASSKSIAVLPFSNVSNDPDNEFFCDGLAEELLSSLARIDGLKVASRTSAFSFKGKDVKIDDVALALGVSSVLEGSVRRSGNRLRITVQLINADDDRPVWSERYDRELEDIFDIQDEIALAVVDALKVKLLGDERAAVLKRYTNNPEAYQLFLKGRFHWYKYTPHDVRKSVEYFRQSIEVDPGYAPGYAGLSEFYGISSALGMMDPAEGWPLAEAAMLRAQELDDSLPEVHNGLAAIKAFFYRDFAGAESELRQTIELNPRFAEVHSLGSFIFAGQGRVDDAIREGQAAIDLDPLSPIHHRNLGLWLYFAGRFDDAVAKYRQVLEMDPNMLQVYEDLRDALEKLGKTNEAVTCWKQVATLTGDGDLLVALTESPSPAVALSRASAARLEQLNRKKAMGQWVAPTEFARLFLRLGDHDSALAWLDRASEVHDCTSLLISADPFYDPLRRDVRFQRIVTRVK